jgi:alkanesulfonate monooxygenase SsuD/methylene tetrahydromethanopterin reductase-like flavin-dependent oxidoreductase (luciferase family)
MGTVGDPDTFGEQIRAMIEAGIDGVTLNLCTVGHDPDLIALTGECADAAIG